MVLLGLHSELRREKQTTRWGYKMKEITRVILKAQRKDSTKGLELDWKMETAKDSSMARRLAIEMGRT